MACNHHYESLDGADASDSEDDDVEIYGQEVALPQDSSSGTAATAEPAKAGSQRAKAYEDWDLCSRAAPSSEDAARASAFLASRAMTKSVERYLKTDQGAASRPHSPSNVLQGEDSGGLTRLVGRPGAAEEQEL